MVSSAITMPARPAVRPATALSTPALINSGVATCRAVRTMAEPNANVTNAGCRKHVATRRLIHPACRRLPALATEDSSTPVVVSAGAAFTPPDYDVTSDKIGRASGRQ